MTIERSSRLERLLLGAVLLLAAQSLYLLARADVTMAYAINVMAHFFVGIVATIGLVAWGFSLRRRDVPARGVGMAAGWLIAASGVAAIALAIVGNRRPTAWLLHVHEGLAAVGVALLLAHLVARVVHGTARVRRLAVVGLLAILALSAIALRPLLDEAPDRTIRNPELPPMTMADEAMQGAKGPFFPSSVHTSTEGRIPSDFLMTSASCGRSGCHPDIVKQWESSMHHFASFNNQFYRKSIEYMQSVAGVESSKWCAGCHDIALLLDGKFDRPVQELLSLPESQAGLACTACHAIESVDGTMGQGGYHIVYPELARLAASKNPVMRFGHDLFVRLDAEPHRKTFLKSFHREQRAEFCSSCHKVHLDVPVNAYRWVRGFNDYDNWQASGVSGLGARSFYEPEKPSDCADCHMPLVASTDMGNRKGFVHDHHFAAANTAVPTANGDTDQIARVEAFLKDKVTVDVFALVRTAGGAPVDHVGDPAATSTEPHVMSSFAVGEEGGFSVGSGTLSGPSAEVVAPIDRAGAAVRRGESVRVDVVVRTRGVGHFFPGGTVDAFDVWVELKAEDEKGKPVFWSGRVEDDGRGPVEPGAHFYRSFGIDEHGNPINKRNAWAMRSVLYVRLVPPGAADTVRYRMTIPPDVGDQIKLEASLHYRKFAHVYTQFAYAGRPDPDAPPEQLAKGFDDRTWHYDADLSTVSGKMKEIPDLPIVTISRAEATLRVLPADAELPAAAPSVKDDRPRWNDYGIGLLLAGDLRGALDAFETVTRLEPGYADGWVNMARVRLREGDTLAAQVALEKALELKPEMPKAHFFRGLALKAEGRLDESLEALLTAHRAKPKDRVVINEIARVHFLQRDFPGAREWGKKVLAIDPEDLMAHYTLMLACRGAGDEEAAAVHETLYERFKADEDAQILTGDYRRTHPWDNIERQPIHEHVGVALGDAPARTTGGGT